MRQFSLLVAGAVLAAVFAMIADAANRPARYWTETKAEGMLLGSAWAYDHHFNDGRCSGKGSHVGTGAKRDWRYSTFSCSLRDAIALSRAIQTGRPYCTTHLELTVTGARTFRKSRLTRVCD
jgi:hypothetical protein